MDKEKYLKDIEEIKNLMTNSSKFISLSGLSGVFAGVFTLVGAFYLFFNKGINDYSEISKEFIIDIFTTIILVGILTTITTVFFTRIRTKETKENIWNSSTKNLIKSYSTTFLIGLILIVINIFQENYTQLIALLIIFYGLALMHSSIFTSNILKPLGIIEIIVGITCSLFPKYSFWFWVLGFGIIHLIYGTVIYFKFDK